ncbi:MAG: selenite/tellurite reduction operon rhodanese-like protein ExtH [Desulfuromonadaceae bacterium]|nr:selenite/tellurite reduction operon rhodanese-like protein ExtH [Desulfuromonadaceae bacterium]
MSEKMMKKSKGLIVALLGTVMIAALTIWGCGTDGYDNPSTEAVTTKTATALITATELKTWVDAGLVNKAGGYDRVVILDSSNNPTATPTDDSTNAYNTVGHIPGAQLISAGSAAFYETRAEGPLSSTGNMVCTGSTMDALIQKAGIDKCTTIVLTNNATNTINMTRAYATFRYWGFPKNRIKILQGGNAGWTAAGYALTNTVPSIQKSTYGVAQNGTTTINTDMRVSLGEMIGYVKGIVAGNTNNVYILDTIRSGKISSTTDLLVSGNNYTPFDGAMKGSYSFPYGKIVTPSGTLNFKDADTLKADISAAVAGDGITTIGDANRDAAKTFIVFCRAGNAASVAYFALDGIAYYNSNVDIKWYDGSLGQWNLMASSDHTAVDTTGATVNAGGKLAVGSIWDTTSLMDNLTWNVSRTISATDLTPRVIVPYGSRVYRVEPSFAEGNQIETADKAYRSTVTGTNGSSASTGGGGC